jgi:hypothetical protein
MKEIIIKEFNGQYIRAVFRNRVLDELEFNRPRPSLAADFDAAEAELRHIRRSMWPGYNEASTQMLTVKLEK